MLILKKFEPCFPDDHLSQSREIFLRVAWGLFVLKEIILPQRQNIFLFMKRHLCGMCETIFRTAVLFSLTIGMSVESVTKDGRKWEKDLDVRTGD